MAFKILIGEPTGKRPLGRPRHSQEDNIRIYIKEMGVNMRNLIVSFKIRIIGEPCECDVEPSDSIINGFMYYFAL